MLIYDMHKIGNRLLEYRKRMGLTQAETAERAAISDRTYADIERGTVNMRISTLQKICEVLHITPNDVLLEEDECSYNPEEINQRLNSCSSAEKETALKLLTVYLSSVQ